MAASVDGDTASGGAALAAGGSGRTAPAVDPAPVASGEGSPRPQPASESAPATAADVAARAKREPGTAPEARAPPENGRGEPSGKAAPLVAALASETRLDARAARFSVNTAPDVAESDDSLSFGEDDDEPAEGRARSKPSAAEESADVAPRSHKQDASGRRARSPPAAVRRVAASPQVDTADLKPRSHPVSATRATSSGAAARRGEAATSACERQALQPVADRKPKEPLTAAPHEAAAARAAAKRKRQQIVFSPVAGGRDGKRAPESTRGAAAAAGDVRPPPKQAKAELVVPVVGGPTRALRIDGLRRPLRESELKVLLSETGCVLQLRVR